MRSTWWHRIVAVGCVALGLATVAPAPAQAELSPTRPVHIQLSSQVSGSSTVLVGLATGSLAFDSSNTWYRLSVTVCQQGSYSFPTFRIFVNGAYQYIYVNRNNARPQVCPANGTLDGDFSSAGTINNITLCLLGVHFAYPPRTPERCDTYDNPYN